MLAGHEGNLYHAHGIVSSQEMVHFEMVHFERPKMFLPYYSTKYCFKGNRRLPVLVPGSILERPADYS